MLQEVKSQSENSLTTTGRYRWVVCGLLFFATTVNYMDRQILSLLKPILDNQLHWSNEQFGAVNSAFQGAYAIGGFIFGYLVDAKSYPGQNVLYVVNYLDPGRSKGLVFAIFLTQQGRLQIFNIQNNATFVRSEHGIDYVDFVVHVFLAERRAYYDIERLRKSARSVDLEELKEALTKKTLAARKKSAAKKAARPAAKKAAKSPAKRATKKAPAKRAKKP